MIAVLALCLSLPPTSPPRLDAPPAQVAVLARDFSKDVLSTVKKDWRRLQGIELEDNPFRDKQRFAYELEESPEFKAASREDRAAAAESLLAWAEKTDDRHASWRAHELRARLLRGGDDAAARDAWTASLEAYPEVEYDVPSKHGSFHHLANARALLDLELVGPAKAVDGLLDLIENDERLVAFYPEGIEQDFIAAGGTIELKRLYGEGATLFKARGEARLARELLVRELPDVRMVGGDPRKTYVLIGGDIEDPRPRHLVVVMPGGNGQALDFLPWLTRITAPLTNQYLFAVLSAPRWSEAQAKEFVWVTEDWRETYEADFAVETFAREVARELEEDTGGKTLLFAWSSGGPAAYSTILSKDRTFDGAYVLASVFKKDQLETKRARGKRFVIEQGRSDDVTPFHFAEAAEKELSRRSAKVKLVAFDGGHGFAMPNARKSLRSALAFLVAPR